MQGQLEELRARLAEEERRSTGGHGGDQQHGVSIALAKSMLAALEAQAAEIAELKRTMSWAVKRM